MNIQILSDLHFEFHQDFGEEFITSYLSPDHVDVLVIAGDLGVGKSLIAGLKLLYQAYDGIPIVYVPGNHEYYHSSFFSMRKIFKAVNDTYENVHILDNNAVEIGGKYFVGSTLWFPKSPDIAHELPRLNDVRCISNFANEVFEENERCKKFLEWHVNSDAVVITHMLPSAQSIHKKYEGDSLNQLFMCPMDELIAERKPKLWIHGHTHDSTHYMHHDTHVVCNPLGYVGHEINPAFIPKMIIDV